MMTTNSGYRFEHTEEELLQSNDEPAQVQVNIYESDEENSPNSRSPTN